MSTLTEFLLARIAEDEAAIRKASAPYDVPHWPGCDYPGDMTGYCDCGYPARVLAECEAKRRIVKELATTRKAVADVIPGGSGRLAVTYGLDAALRALAVPYADHPDYDEAWRP